MSFNKHQVHSYFQQEGLLPLGIVGLSQQDDLPQYQEWLNAGMHADMFFLEKYMDVRADLTKLLPGARSAIVFAFRYGLVHEQRRLNDHGRIASYALMKDYHRHMKKRATHAMENLLKDKPSSQNVSYRVAIDTLPIMERALAKNTTSGFIGKNTCYIHPDYGSFMLLGEVLCNLDLERDQPAKVDPTTRTAQGGCGSCRRCQVHCPTGALSADYKLDANRCIAYWTIEHRGAIPKDIWPWLGDYVFGCDLCQAVCPYNRTHKAHKPHDLELMPAQIDLYELATITQTQYEQRFGGTPVTRAKRHGLRRNALIAMFINQDKRLNQAIEDTQKDPHPVLTETIQQIQSS